MTEARLDNGRVKATGSGRGRWFATGGILGAALASTCCIVPLVLVMLGISGAWIGSLTALAPYQPYFVVVTLGFLAGGFWHVYFRPRIDCADDSYCARPLSSFITKSALWLATFLVILTMTMQYWAPLFY